MTALAWKFIRPDRKLCHGGDRSWVAGETVTEPGPLVLCERGLHASIRPRDALKYATDERTWLARVECGGEIVTGEDKVACSEMRVLWIADPTATLQRLALRWADHAVRVTAAGALRAAGLTAEANRLAACAEIIDKQTARAASDAAGAASYAAWAAREAAINDELEAAFEALAKEAPRG